MATEQIIPIVGAPDLTHLIEALNRPVLPFAVMVDGKVVTVMCHFIGFSGEGDRIEVPGHFEGLGAGIARYDPDHPGTGELTITVPNAPS